jgi:hypothetical protein
VLLLVSRWLTRLHHPVALPWWLLAVSLLGYALGKTLQVTFNQFVFSGALPFPWWSDGLALVTFLGFFLAPVLWPGVHTHHRAELARAKLLFDTLLVMGAVTAVAWYFFLAPLFQRSSASWPAKAVDLAYVVVDLGGCFALVVVLLRPKADVRYEVVLRLLLFTAVCLILADAWTLGLRLYAPSGSAAFPTLLYGLAALLLPLAALVQYRLLQHPWLVAGRAMPKERSVHQRDLRACLRLLLPFVAALVAGLAIEAHMLLAPMPVTRQVVPHLVILLLVLVALARQTIGFLDYVHVQREREEARAAAQGWREWTWPHERGSSALCVKQAIPPTLWFRRCPPGLPVPTSALVIAIRRSSPRGYRALEPGDARHVLTEEQVDPRSDRHRPRRVDWSSGPLASRRHCPWSPWRGRVCRSAHAAWSTRWRSRSGFMRP